MLYVNYILIKIKLNLINEIKLSELKKKKRFAKLIKSTITDSLL